MVSATFRLFYPPERDPVSIIKAAGWTLGQSWTARKVSPPPGFELRIVQPVAIPTTLSRPDKDFRFLKYKTLL
jgi:hypothetical protein